MILVITQHPAVDPPKFEMQQLQNFPSVNEDWLEAYVNLPSPDTFLLTSITSTVIEQTYANQLPFHERDNNKGQYIGFASLTALVWDHIDTFADEVEYIWKGRKGPCK